MPNRNKQEEEILKAIGKNIRNIRQINKFTQEEFAYITGFSRSYYTEIETGKRNISILNFLKILKALNTEPNSVLLPLLNDIKEN